MSLTKDHSRCYKHLQSSPVLLEVVQVVHFPQRHVLQDKAMSDAGVTVMVISLATVTYRATLYYASVYDSTLY